MQKYKYIKEIPKTITKKKYLELENIFKKFAKDLNLEVEELDLLLWYLEAGYVFK